MVSQFAQVEEKSEARTVELKEYYNHIRNYRSTTAQQFISLVGKVYFIEMVI